MITRAFKHYANLDTLPNELLYEIVEQCRHSFENKPYKCHPSFNKFDIIYVLSQVNRRLRAFSAPLVRHDIKFSSCYQLARAIRKCNASIVDYAPFVRCAASLIMSSYLGLPEVYYFGQLS